MRSAGPGRRRPEEQGGGADEEIYGSSFFVSRIGCLGRLPRGPAAAEDVNLPLNGGMCKSPMVILRLCSTARFAVRLEGIGRLPDPGLNTASGLGKPKAGAGYLPRDRNALACRNVHAAAAVAIGGIARLSAGTQVNLLSLPDLEPGGNLSPAPVGPVAEGQVHGLSAGASVVDSRLQGEGDGHASFIVDAVQG
jgi:hypothetical protein